MRIKIYYGRKSNGKDEIYYTFVYIDKKLRGKILHEKKDNGRFKYNIMGKDKYYFNHKKAIKSIVNDCYKSKSFDLMPNSRSF